MPKNSLNVSLKGADDIFSTEESRQEQQREQVQQIPIGELFPFKDHPFKVLDDESMQRTVESVEQYAVSADCPPTPGRWLRDHLRAPPSARRTACRAGNPACHRPSNG